MADMYLEEQEILISALPLDKVLKQLTFLKHYKAIMPIYLSEVEADRRALYLQNCPTALRDLSTQADYSELYTLMKERVTIELGINPAVTLPLSSENDTKVESLKDKISLQLVPFVRENEAMKMSEDVEVAAYSVMIEYDLIDILNTDIEIGMLERRLLELEPTREAHEIPAEIMKELRESYKDVI